MAKPPVLTLAGVGRAFPQDIGESAAALWREMILPRRWVARSGAHGLWALQGVDLILMEGECVGVLGTHRSGKSTLAAIAAGVLAPTAGEVARPGRCVLIARPTAGFKPGLTIRENLELLGMLHGLAGDALRQVLEDVMVRCRVSAVQADSATGNLSPHVVRPLALGLLLRLPADLLVVDGLTAAGTGDMRWAMHGQLRERLSRGACLVLSSDASFLREVTSRVHLLAQGRLSGAFTPDEVPALCRLWSADTEGANEPGLASDDGVDGLVDEVPVVSGVPAEAHEGLQARVPWQLLRVTVDGDEFRHVHTSLIRRPGELIRVELELRSAHPQRFEGGRFELHGGCSGTAVARWDEHVPGIPVRAGQCARLGFDLQVPDVCEDFCGLSFTPAFGRQQYLPPHRLKVLIYGVGRRHSWGEPARLGITRLSFETERNASHALIPDNAVPIQGQPAAHQVG